MKCPNCKTEMEEGFLDNAHWISGSVGKMGKIWRFGRKALKAIAWKCSNCKKIELVSE